MPGMVRVMAEWFPSKRHAEVLSPGTCERDLRWKQGLNQVKTKSY